jgi:hypothetical protein
VTQNRAIPRHDRAIDGTVFGFDGTVLQIGRADRVIKKAVRPIQKPVVPIQKAVGLITRAAALFWRLDSFLKKCGGKIFSAECPTHRCVSTIIERIFQLLERLWLQGPLSAPTQPRSPQFLRLYPQSLSVAAQLWALPPSQRSRAGAPAGASLPNRG